MSDDMQLQQCGMKTAIGIYKQALFGLDHLQFEDIT